MATVNYVACPSCHGEYYIDRILSDVVKSNPDQILKCPFCKQEFKLGTDNGPERGHGSKSGAAARSTRQ